MPKIDISTVAEALKRHREITPTLLREIVEELNHAAQPEEADEPAPPKQKTQLAILADSSGTRGWVIQMPDSASPASLIDRINEAAHAFNSSKKGRLLPVKSISEALSGVSRKWFKNVDSTTIKTKESVAIISLALDKLSEPPTV